MQFSPDKSEIYSSYLRNYIQNNGYSPKKLRNILIFELLYNNRCLTPTDLTEFLDVIFTSAEIELLRKQKIIKYLISGDEIKNINRKAVSLILMECIVSSSKHENGFIEINLNFNEIIIKFKGEKLPKEIIKVAKREGFICFYSKETETTALKGEFLSCAHPEPLRENVWDLLLNPYSLLHTII